MSDAWQYQLRIYLPDELVETARLRSDDPALGQLPEILQKHGASMKSQFDAFAEYVVEAERNGTDSIRSTNGRRRPLRIPPRSKSISSRFLFT